MTPRLRFCHLAIGEYFEFAHTFSGMARGPWKKVTRGKYQDLWTGLIHQVGTTKTEVYRVTPRDEDFKAVKKEA